MINLPATGLSDNHTNIDYISDDRESDSTNYLQNEDHRKSYPQRHNRAKLNYRDLERGMYEEIRQSMWGLGGPSLVNKSNVPQRNAGEVELIDLSIDDDEKSNDGSNQIQTRLYCICKKPWDHLRHMLRCDLCVNWYHADCVGVTKEQAREIERTNDQFNCPSCRGTAKSVIKSARSSEESILTKRKRSDNIPPSINHKNRENGILSKSISHDESTKRPKKCLFLQSHSLPETQIHCIANGCKNLVKSDWIYCSSACIRRHINDRLEAIQQSKGMDNDDIPTRDDILLYDNKTKKRLEKNLVPNIENLSIWINRHPSYEILNPPLRTTNQSTGIEKSLSSVVNKLKSNQQANAKPKKNPISFTKQTSHTKSNVNNPADIRSKVPTTLYEKIIMRLEKNNEKHLIKPDIRGIVKRIEEEMYRVYGKVDNSYKNKFRSLLANISNTNNNFFYKYILSTEVTAKQIVAMKPEDMLPPEEKEKRKDQFEKEVQMSINAEQQRVEEMARHKRMKITKQGLVDNDILVPMVKLKEQSSSEEKVGDTSKQQTMDNTSKSIIPRNDKEPIVNIQVNNQTSSAILPEPRPSVSVTKKMHPNKSLDLPIPEPSNPTFPVADLDNDYIEPESPTGIDALIYDDDDHDDNEDINSSSIDNPELTLPCQQVILDDYNPSKIQNQSKPIVEPPAVPRLPNQWRGIIHPSDTKIPSQSVHSYGESDYLIGNIPEQLIILGRLRLGDLWDYIRESLAVRDVLILTLISSSTNSTENETFSQYFDTMFLSGRAAVIHKCTNTSLIRDMYVLAADTKHCPSSVLSSLFLPITFESKQLFLVIIGTGKTKIKSLNRSNELLNNLIYKPVALQDSTIIRDPRLGRNKDPRLNGRKATSDNIMHSTTQSSNTKQGNNSIPVITIVDGDNLIEENMDVDDDQDDKHKKQLTISSNSNLSSVVQDVDYRFRDQDMDQPMTTTEDDNNHRKQRRKSRFSDPLPMDHERSMKLKSNNSINELSSKEEEEKSSDKLINSSLTNKFRPIINSTESFLSSTNAKDKLTSKPIRFAFSKDPIQQNKLSISSTMSNKDSYETSSKGNEDLNQSSDNCTKQTLPITPIRSTAMLNLLMQQQKTKNRFSSSTNEWRSSSYNNYMTHYHDFDQPQE